MSDAIRLGAKPAKGSVVALVPQSPVTVSNCIPFGNNTDYGFSGFIYRNVSAFHLLPGDAIRFDLGDLDYEQVRRNIYFSPANINPGPATGGDDTQSQGVRAVKWKQVVSDTQVPASPHGNTVIGDYELRYQAEKAFHFKGGGLIVGFGSSPPGQYADAGCEQVGVSTTNEDASGRFYARFCFKPNLATEPLDVAGDCGGTGVELQGMILRTSGRVPPHN